VAGRDGHDHDYRDMVEREAAFDELEPELRA